MRISLLLSTVLLFGCVTRNEVQKSAPSQQSSAPAIAAPVTTLPVIAATTPDKGEKNIAVYIEKVFPQNGWKNLKGEKEFWYGPQQPDVANGFANIQGLMEGHINFYLFLGDKKNLLVKEVAGCGPACNISFNFYSFEKNATSHREVSFKDLIDPQTQNRLTHELNNCFDYKKLEKSTKKTSNVPVHQDICFRYFQFPQKGKEINIYKTKQDTLEKGDEIRIDKRLSWNGEHFIFTKEYSKTPWQKF